MSNGLYRAAVAMSGHERRLETIAANLANLGTVGFKRSSSATHEFEVAKRSGKVRGQVQKTVVDFSQGNLERTGRALDLALEGDGFFAVESPSGEVYTRAGDFRTTDRGILVTDSGLPVAWERRGSVIDPTGLPLVIDGEGAVWQGDAQLGRLKIVAFEDNQALRQQSGGYWVAPRGLREVTNTSVVHQYALEESNATGMEEIVEMIGVQRTFENVAKLVTSMQRSYARLTRST